MPEVVGVKFKRAGKVYSFSPAGNKLEKDDGVIVETARGTEFGRVTVPNHEVPEKELNQPLKEILRKATEKDIETVRRNEEKKPETMKTAKEKIAKHNLDMKLVDCEYTFDGNKLVFYFTADGRVDFRDLVKDLASAFRIRIELRQIGIRDEAKMRGGIAPCGKPCCCSYHLPDFKRVSIKMAKTQGLSLNPGKISGLCGRLMCCLEYENAHYAEAVKKMPKIGSEVVTPDGKGIVVGNNLLKLICRVKFVKPDNSYEFKEYPVGDLKARRTTQEEEKLSPEEERAAKALED